MTRDEFTHRGIKAFVNSKGGKLLCAGLSSHRELKTHFCRYMTKEENAACNGTETAAAKRAVISGIDRMLDENMVWTGDLREPQP